MEVMLRGGPALVIDRNGVATEVGEAPVLTDRLVELDDFGIFVLLRRCRVLVVGVGNEIRVIVGCLECSGRHVRRRVRDGDRCACCAARAAGCAMNAEEPSG